MSDLDGIIETLRRCECPPETDVKWLCGRAMEVLVEEGNVLRVDAPVTVCGDIHGQARSLEHTLALRPETAWPPGTQQSSRLGRLAGVSASQPASLPLSLPGSQVGVSPPASRLRRAVLRPEGALFGGRRLPRHQLPVHGGLR